MSHIDQGPLPAYNSLADNHLTGYFSNTRMRRHLRKSGLITNRGEIVSENTYRLNMGRKEHKKHVKDMLAQAIVHKTLDLERVRQAEIQKKLEEIAKIEMVRRVKISCEKKRETYILPLVSPRAGSRHSSNTSTTDQRYRGRYRPMGQRNAHSRKGKRPISAMSSNYDDENETVVYLDDEGRPISPAHVDEKEGRYSSKDPIDTRHLYSLDTAALRKYAVLMAKMEQGKDQGSSPYLIPQVPLPPKSPGYGRTPRSAQRYRQLSGLSKSTEVSKRPATAGQTYLHSAASAKLHRGQQETMCEVCMIYHGSSLFLAREQFDKRQDVMVEQQHCGGNTLTVFKDKMEAGTEFSFISYRHRGYPFSLSIYIDGKIDCRVSTCCEFRHSKGGRIGGKKGHLSIQTITGAIPCYKCHVERGIRIKSAAPHPKLKRPPQQQEEVIVVETKKQEETEYRVVESEERCEEILVPVEDVEDEKKSDTENIVSGRNDYDDDFESSGSEREGELSNFQPKESRRMDETTGMVDIYDVSSEEEEDKVETWGAATEDRAKTPAPKRKKRSKKPKSQPRYESETESETDNEKGDRVEVDDTSDSKEKDEVKGIEEENSDAPQFPSMAMSVEVEEDKKSVVVEEATPVMSQLPQLPQKENSSNTYHEQELKTQEEEKLPESEKNVKPQRRDSLSSMSSSGSTMKSSATSQGGNSDDYSNSKRENKEEYKQEDEDIFAHQAQATMVMFKPPENEAKSEAAVDDPLRTGEETAINERSDVPKPAQSEERSIQKKESDGSGAERSIQKESDGSGAERSIQKESDSSGAERSIQKKESDSSGAERSIQKESDGSEAERNIQKKESDSSGAGDSDSDDDGNSSSTSSSSSSVKERAPEKITQEEEDVRKESMIETTADVHLSQDGQKPSYDTKEDLEIDPEETHGGNDPDNVANATGLVVQGEQGAPSKPMNGSVLPLLEANQNALEIKGVTLNKTQVYEMASYLEKKDSIRGISIVNCGIDDDDVQKIMEVLRESPSNPVIINFSLNPLTSACVNHILDAVKVKTSVEAVLLSGTRLGDDGVSALVKGMLQQHEAQKETGDSEKGLHELDLSDCKFGDQGALGVAKLLASDMDIDTLTLSCNYEVSKDGWKAIGGALHGNKNLETLTLDHNYIGDNGIEHIANGLYNNTSITALDLNDIGLTDRGGKSLIEMLKRNITILEIVMMGNKISDALEENIQKYIALNKASSSH